MYYRNKPFLNHTGEQLELINSSLEAEDLAAFCLDLAWRAAANEDFKACNLSNYVQDFEKQVSRAIFSVQEIIFHHTIGK